MSWPHTQGSLTWESAIWPGRRITLPLLLVGPGPGEALAASDRMPRTTWGSRGGWEEVG